MKFAAHRTHTRFIGWFFAGLLALAAAYPFASRWYARRSLTERLDRAEAIARVTRGCELDPALSLRVQRLSPLLSSWETVGGCGAGSTGGVGIVKWVGRNTTGGLFQDITQANYIKLQDGYNLILTTQVSRDIDDRWNVGVLVPYLYKRYNNYLNLTPPVDISNSGLGDINLLGTYKFGEIRDTSLTLSLGLPTGTHNAAYKMDLLTQEKQLGPGRVSGTLMLDHTIDEQWGLIVVGGMAGWRGGQNELGNYRAPFASAYAYAGYFLGPFVPTLGVAATGFPQPDRDRGLEQDVPLVLAAANASIEWSTDWIALLVGVSVPFGLYAKKSAMVGGVQNAQSSTGIQPWTAALGVSISPF
jgi:hypothetical protein